MGKDFKGMDFTWRPRDISSDWSAFLMDWPTWTAHNWQIPLVSVALYFIIIPTLRWMVAKYGKWNVRNVAFYWNAFLSVFSWCGVFACVPVMTDQFFRHGLYFTCCAPAMWYGGGLCGFFVGLFIYSKVGELFDTVLLLLAGKPVIALQWWHHSTVLLYCWHSYSCRIATGLLVCRHELLSALRDVRVLRPDDDQVPQAHHPVRDLHHAGAACADARRDVCDHQGYDVAGCWCGVPREQDKLRAGPDHVCQLLPALLQALRGELCDPDSQAWWRG